MENLYKPKLTKCYEKDYCQKLVILQANKIIGIIIKRANKTTWSKQYIPISTSYENNALQLYK